MALDYVLDEQDLDTRRFINNIAHSADEVKVDVLRTQSTYEIRQARLIALNDTRYVGTPINALGVKLDVALTGFESEPGRLAHVVNEVAKTLAEQYLNGDNKARNDNVSLIYVLNEEEVKKMMNGGLYENPIQYNNNMNLVLTGANFSLPDQIRLTNMKFNQKVNRSIGVGELPPVTQYEISSVQPDNQENVFDHQTENNAFTFVFSKVADALTQRRLNPEQAEDDIVADAEARNKQHQQAMLANGQQQNQDQQSSDEVEAINNQTGDYLDQIKQSQKVGSTSKKNRITRLADKDELHLQQVIDEMQAKADKANQALDDKNITTNARQVRDEIDFNGD